MSHGPPTEWKKDKSEDFKTKLGIIMFIVYATLYLAFVLLCVLSPRVVAMKLGIMNIAVSFGFFLIIAAIVQALVYNAICSRRERGDKEIDEPEVKNTNEL
jgi:uncharacterized membrane protein (DUF485 family)